MGSSLSPEAAVNAANTTTPPLRPVVGDDDTNDLSPTLEMLHGYQHHGVKSDSEYSEERLRRENDILRVATSQTNTILLDLSLKAEVRYLSKAWQDIVGTPVKSIVNKPISDIIFGDDEDKGVFARAIRIMLQEETSFLVRFTTKLGPLRNIIDTNSLSPSDSETLGDLNLSGGGSSSGELSPTSPRDGEHNAEDMAPEVSTSTKHDDNDGNKPDAHQEATNVDQENDKTPNPVGEHEEEEEDDLIELEGQGMLFRDGAEPSHTLWFLKPYIPPKPLNIALPRKLTELLGSGAVFLVTFLEELSDSILMNSTTVPAQPLELCRICERHMPLWYFERHCEFCVLESKAEEAVALSHEELMEHRNQIAALISAYENPHSNNLHSPYLSFVDSPTSPTAGSSSSSSSSSLSPSYPFTDMSTESSGRPGSVSPRLMYKGVPLPAAENVPTTITNAATIPITTSYTPSLHLSGTPVIGSNSSGSISHTSPPRSPKLMTSSPLSGSRTLKSAPSFSNTKKSPLRFLELLLELCDMALDIKSPEVRYAHRATYKEETGDMLYMHIHSPTSETRIHQVLDWSEANINDSGLALLCEDTTRLARLKVDHVIRLGNILMYSEKVRLDVERSVHTFIENTVDKTVRRMENVIHSSDDEAHSTDEDDLKTDENDEDYSFGDTDTHPISQGVSTPKNLETVDNESDLGDNTVIIYDSKSSKDDKPFSDSTAEPKNFFMESYSGSKVPSFNRSLSSGDRRSVSPLHGESSTTTSTTVKSLVPALSGLSLDDSVHSSDGSMKSPLSQKTHVSGLDLNNAETPTSLLNFSSSITASAIPISVAGHSSSRDYSSSSIGSTSPTLSFSSKELKMARPKTAESVSMSSFPVVAHEESMSEFDLNSHPPSSPAVNIRKLQSRRSFGSTATSPRAFTTSPLSGINRGRLNSMSANTDGTFSPSSPMAFSPLIVPYDPDRNHRRKSSTASDFSKGAMSPLLSATTPSGKPSQPSIRDFEIICPISKGAFGSVYLSRKKLTGDYFAIKVLKKADMIAKNQVMNVKSERAIMMAQADSPFVAQLFFTFQNKDYLFLVMEYLNGGDCAGLIKALGALTEQWCQQYLAEAVVAVAELHKRGIIHRDLKPENLLIDSKGHLKLIDFGLSRMGAAGRFTRDVESAGSRANSGSSSIGLGLNTDAALMPPPPAPMSHQNQTFPSGDFSDHMTSTSIGSSNSGSAGSMHTMSTTGIPLSDPSISFAPGYFNIDNSRSKGDRKLSLAGHGSSVGEAIADDVSSNASSENNALHSPRSGSSNFNTSQKYALYGDRAKRFAGTPDYLAPETIKGYEQDDMSDWWSLGCILFEFLYGYPPFHDSTPEKVFQNILNRRIDWPDPEDEIIDGIPIASPEAKDLINKLLTVDPSARLGARGVDEIKQHQFFSSISNWDTLWDDEASFIPRKVDPESTEYFDSRGAVMEEFANEMNLEDTDTGRQNNSNHDSGDEFSSGGGPSRSNTESPLSRENRPGPKFLPLHIPPHVREGRSRRLSDTSAGNDFGLFSFKNVPVLDKANKELINKMKQESIEREGRTRASFSSNTKSGNFSATLSSGSTPSSGDSRQVSPIRNSSAGSNTGGSNSATSGPPGGATAIRLGSSAGSTSAIISPLKIPALRTSELTASHGPSSDHTSSPSSETGCLSSPMKPNRRMSAFESSPEFGEHFRHSMSRPTGSAGSNVFEISPSVSDAEESSKLSPAHLRVQKRRQLSRRTSRSSYNAGRSTSDGMLSPSLDILVCYSNPVWRYSIERMLVKLGCRVVSVSSGQEAIRRVTGDVRFDLIILEYKIGKIQAADVARLIHNTQNVNLDTPIATVSTLSPETATDPEIFKVFSGVITKPPTEEKMITELKKHYPDWTPKLSKGKETST